MPIKLKHRPLVKGSEALAMFAKAMGDPWYFIENVRIYNESLGNVLFKLYGFQKKVVLEYLRHKQVITLKPRQMGITVLTCAYVLWFAMFNPGKTIILVSLKATVAMGLLRKIRWMYRSLPDALKCPIRNGQETIGTNTVLEFENDTRIIAMAATEDVGRSETASLVVLDEVAIMKYASTIYTSIKPTLFTGGRIIMISTPFGTGNFYHEHYTQAMQGKIRTFPIKLDWRDHPDRDQAWYDRESADLGPRRTAQEIDCEFLSSGFNVFEMARIKIMEETYNTLKESGRIEYLMNGELLVFDEPIPNTQYYLGADIATGRSRDFSAFSIMDRLGKEVACFKGKMNAIRFADLIMKWGYKYNYALLAPERNGVGESVVNQCLTSGYEYLYAPNRQVKLDHIVLDEGNNSYVPGFPTTTESRKRIIDALDHDILFDPNFDMANPFFCAEAKTFIYDNANRPVAMGKAFGRRTMEEDIISATELGNISYVDDSILAAAITNDVRKAGAMAHETIIFKGGR